VRTIRALVVVASLLHTGLATAAEIQVPLDRAGRVQRVDARMARQLGLFSDRPGFQEARLFQLPDSSFVLEITSTREAGLLRDRVPLSAAGADSVRDLVTQAMTARPTETTINQSGRPLLLTTTTVLGVGFYGWVTPYLLSDNTDDRAMVAAYLVTASAATYIPMWLTKDGSVTEGAAVLAMYGMTRGGLHGGLLPHALVEDPSDQAWVATAAAFSIAEGFAGHAWASKSAMRPGAAHIIGTGGDFGGAFGLGFAHLADAGDQGYAAALIVGSGLGVAAGGMYARDKDYSYGDAGVQRAAGWLGGFVGLAAQQIAAPDEWNKATTGITMAASAAGLAVGDRLVRGTEFSFGQSIIVDVGTIGGALFCLGIGTLSSNERIAWASTAAGGVLGYWLSYRGQSHAARRAGADRTSWQFDLAPVPPTRLGAKPGVALTLRAALP
jgi:hypothetical protein